MIKPTVGRVVWCYNSEDPEEPLAAIVCHVHNDRMVSLMVIAEEGHPLGSDIRATSARRRQAQWRGVLVRLDAVSDWTSGAN